MIYKMKLGGYLWIMIPRIVKCIDGLRELRIVLRKVAPKARLHEC